MKLLTGSALVSGALFTAILSAQPPAGAQNEVVHLDRQPIYKVTVVSRTAKAVNYRHRSGSTKVDFAGTALMPRAKGDAKVNSKQGTITIDADFSEISGPASQFGPEYLTYVLWAISPEGRAINLGEVLVNGGKSKLNVTSDLQAFGMIVTAEPYFAVRTPSDVVVMENIIRGDTRGKVEEIDAKYELLQRGQYTFNVNRSKITPITISDPMLPLEIYEARNALQIARWTGADKYAADTYQKAQSQLSQSEDYQVRKQKKPAIMIAREAAQTAEDAREIAVKRMDEERLAQERQAAADRENAAKMQAAEAARQRAMAEEQQRLEAERRARAEAETKAAEAQRMQAEAQTKLAQQQTAEAEQARLAADRARQEADAARMAASREREAADAARLAAQQETEKARMAAAESDRMRMKAETDKEELRKQLLQQFNLILETRDTARGLIVNMSDVLFDTGKYTLRPAAREKLAKVAGILLAHPGLTMEVEGHTDSVGGDAYNQTLSENRATAVQAYLIHEGLPAQSITAKGFGKTMPVASNDTAAGRQQNRRVEMVVSGEIIGTKLTGVRVSPAPQQ